MENNNVAIFPFTFNIFMPLANVWFILFKDSFPTYGQEVATRSSALREGLCHLVEGESVS